MKRFIVLVIFLAIILEAGSVIAEMDEEAPLGGVHPLYDTARHYDDNPIPCGEGGTGGGGAPG